MFSAPLALGLVPRGSGGSSGHGSGCHCRGWARSGDRQEGSSGGTRHGRDVTVCASMEEVPKDRNWLLELLVSSDAKRGKLPTLFSYLGTFYSLELTAAAFPVIKICFLICVFGILSLFLKMHLVSLNLFSPKRPFFHNTIY